MRYSRCQFATIEIDLKINSSSYFNFVHTLTLEFTFGDCNVTQSEIVNITIATLSKQASMK